MGGLGSRDAGALAENLLLETSTKGGKEEGSRRPNHYSDPKRMKVLSDFRKQQLKFWAAREHFKSYQKNKFIFPQKLLLGISIPCFLDLCLLMAPGFCFPIDLVYGLVGKVNVTQSFRNYCEGKNKYYKIISSSMTYARKILSFPCSRHRFYKESYFLLV